VTDKPQRPPIRVSDKRMASSEGGQAPPSSKPPFEEELEAARAKVKELEDELLRERADYANYKKRLVREQIRPENAASLRVVEKLLPIVDDFERGLDAIRSHPDDEKLLRGIEIVLGRLHEVLTQEGIERVIAEGTFDPHEHEAVSSVPGNVDEPTVLEVVRPGYKLKGKTIRPALVHVTVPEADEKEGREK